MGINRYTWRSFSRELLMILLALTFCLPFYVLAILSLKTFSETFTEPFAWPSDPKFGNYSQAWQEAGETGLARPMIASAVITGTSVVILCVLGSLCAYALARRPSKMGTSLYVLFVLGIILPFQLAIIPVYVVMRDLGLTGTYLGMILLYTGLLMPFAVFLYTGFIRVLPRDYEEAAQVDGAGLFRTWLRVVFPLLIPVSGTVAVLAGLFIWNDFFISLIFLFGSQRQTLPVALFAFVGEYTSQWQLIMAGVAISVAPILAFYLLAQRQLIRGFAGGIRG